MSIKYHLNVYLFFFWAVDVSVDSEYLLTRVLTREYLFFDTFWHSSLLKFDLSLLTILERVEYT